MDISHLRMDYKEPCRDARRYCARFKTIDEAWRACREHPGWLAWYGEAVGADIEGLVAFCASKVTERVIRRRGYRWGYAEELAEAATETLAEACNLIREFWPTPPEPA